jgi:hypothetical protein
MGHRPFHRRRLNEFQFGLRLGIHSKKCFVYYSFTICYPLACIASETESTEPRSCLEANSFSAGQELLIIRKPTFRYLSPTFVPNLSQMNTYHAFQYQGFKNILILYSLPRLSPQYRLFTSDFNTKPSMLFFSPSNTCHIFRPSHSLWFDRANAW